MTTRVLKKSRAVSTLDIWPWKYLVPWMREDLFSRVCLSYPLHYCSILGLGSHFIVADRKYSVTYGGYDCGLKADKMLSRYLIF
jgi:hypothetical protein